MNGPSGPEHDWAVAAVWRLTTQQVLELVGDEPVCDLGEFEPDAKTILCANCGVPFSHAAASRACAVPGRNDACPCGSGAKYKRCCGR